MKTMIQNKLGIIRSLNDFYKTIGWKLEGNKLEDHWNEKINKLCTDTRVIKYKLISIFYPINNVCC